MGSTFRRGLDAVRVEDRTGKVQVWENTIVARSRTFEKYGATVRRRSVRKVLDETRPIH
jgi:hypothetical protein